MERSPSPGLLHGVLAALATLASLLALKALIWPRWPTAAPLNQQAIAQRLRSHGFESNPVAPLPARRSYKRATSEALGFAIGDGETLRVMRGSARERLDLQMAFLAASNPALTLQKRQVVAGPILSAIGENGGTQLRQTCQVSGSGGQGGYGVTDESLLNLVDRLPSDRWQRLQVLLGSRLPRDYSCVLISVSARAGSPAIGGQRWQRLLEALRPALTDRPVGG